MQRLVAVDARDRDEVLEAAGHRFVKLVHDAESPVAVIRILHNQPKTEYVGDLAERATLLAHLSVDAVDVLLAADHDGLDLHVRKRLFEPLGDLAQELPLISLRAVDRLLEHPVSIRVGEAETVILEFGFQGVDAEAVGDGRVDLECLARDSSLFVDGQRAQGLHVVQPVRQLQQDDADVLDHRQHHFAEALDLRLRPAVEAELVELADAVDDGGDLGAEFCLDLVLRRRRVFDHVVHDRGGDALVVHPQVGKDSGDRDRVRYVKFTRVPALAFVCLGRELVGVDDGVELGRGQVLQLG